MSVAFGVRDLIGLHLNREAMAVGRKGDALNGKAERQRGFDELFAVDDEFAFAVAGEHPDVVALDCVVLEFELAEHGAGDASVGGNGVGAAVEFEAGERLVLRASAWRGEANKYRGDE